MNRILNMPAAEKFGAQAPFSSFNNVDFTDKMKDHKTPSVVPGGMKGLACLRTHKWPEKLFVFFLLLMLPYYGIAQKIVRISAFPILPSALSVEKTVQANDGNFYVLCNGNDQFPYNNDSCITIVYEVTPDGVVVWCNRYGAPPATRYSSTLTGSAIVVDNITGNIPEDNGQVTIYSYPNPVTESAYINVTGEIRTTATVSVVDLTGQILSNTNTAIVPGANHIAIDMGRLNKGIYILRVSNADKSINASVRIEKE